MHTETMTEVDGFRQTTKQDSIEAIFQFAMYRPAFACRPRRRSAGRGARRVPAEVTDDAMVGWVTRSRRVPKSGLHSKCLRLHI